MHAASAFCFLLLSLLSSVYSSPVPGALKIMSNSDPKKHVSNPQDRKQVVALRKANKEANSQYKHMAGILANLNKPEHAATIQKALGNNPDPTAIAKNVEMLKKKRIMSNYDRKKHVSNPQNQQRVAALRKANKEANSQYKHMERVLANPNKPEHAAAIQKAFGNSPNLAAITANVKALRKKTSLIKTVEEPFNPNKPKNVAFSRTRKDGKKHLHFGDRFFNEKTPSGQAGTLIHEASHQLLDTKDNFEKTRSGTFHAVSKTDAMNSKRPIKSGYLHKHYEEIKKGGSDVMHQNADSYKAFGHYAKYGATTSMRHTRVLRHKKKRHNLRNQEAV